LKQLLEHLRNRKEPHKFLESQEGLKQLLEHLRNRKEPHKFLESQEGLKQLLEHLRNRKEPHKFLESQEGLKRDDGAGIRIVRAAGLESQERLKPELIH
jgi:hypothetical protein